MKYVTVRLSRVHQTCLYVIFTLIFVTGACWLIFHYWVPTHNEFGEAHHPSEPWWMRLHGAASFLFLFLFGTVVPNHIRRAWQLRRNQLTGVTFCSVNALLVFSGYALYYFSAEDTRAAIGAAHWIVGLGFPALIGWHVWAGRRARHSRHASIDSIHS